MAAVACLTSGQLQPQKTEAGGGASFGSPRPYTHAQTHTQGNEGNYFPRQAPACSGFRPITSQTGSHEMIYFDRLETEDFSLGIGF